jgi:hypothetical protein
MSKNQLYLYDFVSLYFIPYIVFKFYFPEFVKYFVICRLMVQIRPCILDFLSDPLCLLYVTFTITYLFSKIEGLKEWSLLFVIFYVMHIVEFGMPYDYYQLFWIILCCLVVICAVHIQKMDFPSFFFLYLILMYIVSYITVQYDDWVDFFVEELIFKLQENFYIQKYFITIYNNYVHIYIIIPIINYVYYFYTGYDIWGIIYHFFDYYEYVYDDEDQNSKN